MKIITPTLALCLAGAIAAGIGLARPAQSTTPPDPTLVSAPRAPTAEGLPARSDPIEIADFTFNSIAVAPGSIVEVRNVDSVAHTVTANDLFDTGNIEASSAATFVAPAEPGIYDFLCGIHPSMQGTLTVG